MASVPSLEAAPQEGGFREDTGQVLDAQGVDAREGAAGRSEPARQLHGGGQRRDEKDDRFERGNPQCDGASR